MNIDDDGLKLIEGFEGLRLKAYKDVKGVLTIGYGHTGSDVFDGQIITNDEAQNLLQKDIQNAVQSINQLVKVPLNQNQFNALCSFVFNVGIGNFRSSTLLKLINQSDFENAANEFLKWSHAGKIVVQGLLDRRIKEQELFSSP